MIIINNGTQDYEIIEKDIQYFYKHGLELRFVNKLNTQNIVFTTRNTLRAAIDKLVTTLHKKLATIPALLLGVGVIYWIYCPNISAHSVTESTITITHQSGTQDISCINSIAAGHHNQRLYYSYCANHLPEYLSDKRLLYVRPDYTNNLYKRQYSSWTNALNNSKAGDVILIEPGEYVVTQVILKNKVDTVVFPGAVITKSDDDVPYMMHCNNKTVDSKIFGEGIFNRSASVNFGSASMLEVNGNNSKVFFQFNEIHCDSTFSLHSSNGSVWMKGYLGDVVRIQDSDDIAQLVDIDVLRVICSGEGFYPDNVAQTYFYALNGYLQSAIDGMYMQNIAGDYDITLANMKIGASGTGVYIQGVGQDMIPDNLRTWFTEIKAPTPYINDTPYSADIQIYDDLVISSEITGGNYEYPLAEPTLDAGLTMTGNTIDNNNVIGTTGEITYRIEGGHLTLVPELVDNAAYYLFYKNGVLAGIGNYAIPSFTLSEIYDGGYNTYTYEARRELQISNLSNYILIPNIMALSNKPRKTKYTTGDTVFYNDTGAIVELTVKGVRAVVQNPNNTAHGMQHNYYTFNEVVNELREERLYSTKNHLLSALKGSYLNNDAYVSIETSSTERDYAGLNMEYIDFTETGRPIAGADAVLEACTFDNVKLKNAILPAIYDTKPEFVEAVASYDNKSTIWKDGFPIKDWSGLSFTAPGYNAQYLIQSGLYGITLRLLTPTKGVNWTISFATGGSESVSVNTSTRTIAIVYINLTSTNHSIRLLLNANADFLLHFHPVDLPSIAVITTTSTYTYNAFTYYDLTSIDLTGIYAENCNFADTALPANADTKPEFKALVGSWDPVNTIWTDGLPIGS